MATNTELLKQNKDRLSGLDAQKQLVLHLMTTPMPCPSCGTRQSPLEAHGIAVDDFDFYRPLPSPVPCTGCNRELIYTVPFVAIGNPWHWSLVPIAAKESAIPLNEQPHSTLFMAGPPGAVRQGCYTDGPAPDRADIIGFMSEGDILVEKRHDGTVVSREQLRNNIFVPWTP